jgi:hypothetical protein
MHTGAPERHPSQADEAVRRARVADGRSSTEPLSRKGSEALARLENALSPLPTEPASRRRAINVRGW